MTDKKSPLSTEPCSVDGTRVRAWASHKSFRPKDGHGGDNAPPDAPQCPIGGDTRVATRRLRVQRIRTPAVSQRLEHGRDPLRPGARVDGEPRRARGGRGGHPCRRRRRAGGSLGDDPYDARDAAPDPSGGQGVRHRRLRAIVPSRACHPARGEERDASGRPRDRCSPVALPRLRGSRRIRKRIEEHFGWTKTVGRIRQSVFRGLHRVDLQFKLTMLASNIVQMSRMPAVVSELAVQGAE